MIRSAHITLWERLEIGSASDGCLSTRLIEKPLLSVDSENRMVNNGQLAKSHLQHDNDHPKLKRDPCHREEVRRKVDDSVLRSRDKVSKRQIECLDGSNSIKEADEVDSTRSPIYLSRERDTTFV
jgi:hypothetical protein